MNFREELKSKTAAVEKIVESYLPEESGTQHEIMEAMNYSVTAGGKRLRPLLMQETYRMFGGEGREVESYLPAMDNDEYRRGKLTTHAKFGHAMGVLAGDALLNYAFETAAEAFDKSTDLRRTAKALQILSRKAGIYGMIGGQVVDVQSSGHAIGQDRLDFIYELKTGALLEAAMMVGAVLAGASEEEVSVIEKVASDVGIAFQIRDDILDVTSTLEELGKPIHSDDKNEKTTYVTLKGLKQAEKDVEEISARAIEGLASLPYKNAFLTELIKSLVYREK